MYILSVSLVKSVLIVSTVCCNDNTLHVLSLYILVSSLFLAYLFETFVVSFVIL